MEADIKISGSHVESTIENAIVDFAAKQTKRVPIPVILIVSLIAYIGSAYLPIWMCVLWVAIIVAILVIRAVVLPRLANSTTIANSEKIKIIVLLSLAAGSCQALSLVGFPYFSEAERAVQTMMLVSLCAGAVATTTGYRPFIIAYMLPVLLPLIILWILSPGLELTNLVKYTTAIILVFSTMVLTALANDIYRLFESSFYIRLEQADLNQKLESALLSAEKANQSKTRFLASASHDLRQPLHTLSLFGAALTMQDLNEKTRKIAENMKSAMGTLTSHIDSLLDVSKLDAGIIEISPETIDLGAFMRGLSDEFLQLANEKSIGFETNLVDGIYIQTDTMQFERIIRNIVSNAFKYTEQGTVTINMVADDDRCQIEISDSGPGIPEEKQNLIFEEFYQIDNPMRDKSQGLGLGLSIVKRLVDLLDLEMDMQSTPGVGTKFSLTMATTTAMENTKPQARRARQPGLEGNSILVIDDDESVLQGMEALLSEFGVRIMLANSLKEALIESENSRPDLVLTDYRLSGDESGMDVIRAFREKWPKLPVVLITGDISEEKIALAANYNVNVLPKPVEIDVLREEIISHISPS